MGCQHGRRRGEQGWRGVEQDDAAGAVAGKQVEHFRSTPGRKQLGDIGDMPARGKHAETAHIGAQNQALGIERGVGQGIDQAAPMPAPMPTMRTTLSSNGRLGFSGTIERLGGSITLNWTALVLFWTSLRSRTCSRWPSNWSYCCFSTS